MAVIIIGSGVTPVTGTREFEPIPGGGGGGTGNVTIGSGNTNNYVMTAVGAGDIIQGEPNLQFDGTSLDITGDLNLLSGGNINVLSMDPGFSTYVMFWNSVTGDVVSYDSGGGTTAFLRADGTWNPPPGAALDVQGVPSPGHITLWHDVDTVTSDSNLSWNGSSLGIAGNMSCTGTHLYMSGIPQASVPAVLCIDASTNRIFRNYSGAPGTTKFLREDGTWLNPNAVDVNGTPSAGELVVWLDSDTIRGDSNFTAISGVLTVTSEVKTQAFTELTTNQGIRFLDYVHVGSDSVPTGLLSVTAGSAVVDIPVYIINDGSNRALQIESTSDSTGQLNVVNNAVTSNVARSLEIRRQTTGTATYALGAGIGFSVELDNATTPLVGAIDVILSDPVAATADTYVGISVMENGTLAQKFNFTSDGTFRTAAIDEFGSAGVTIEGVLFKDSDITIPTANYLYFNVGETTHIYDNSGVLTFTDGTTGAKTLAELATATGDVTKVGTPVNNEIGVWTGDGTLEGESNLTYVTNALRLGVGSAAPYIALNQITNANISIFSDAQSSLYLATYANLAANNPGIIAQRYGGTMASPTSAPTNAEVRVDTYNVYDGTSTVTGGEFAFLVDGAIATGDFDTKWTWDLKEGAGASALMLTLGVDGLEYAADHSTDQAANDRWLVDKGYVDSEVAAAGGLSASGTPVNDQLGVWVNASTLEGSANLTFVGTTLDVNNTLTVDVITEHTGSAGVTIETVVLDSGAVTIPDLTGTGTRIVSASAAGLLADGNLTGQVITTNSLATALAASSITAQTALTSGLASTDELLVSDAGVLKRMDVDVLETYMQNNLNFGSGYAAISGTPANNRVAIWTNTTDIEGDANLTWTGTVFDINGSITLGTGETVDTIEAIITDDDTHIPTSGAVVDAITAAGYTFDSGLTEVAGNVDLGGALTQNTLIPATTYTYTITGADADSSSEFYYDANRIRLTTTSDAAAAWDDTAAEFQVQSSAVSSSITGFVYDDGVGDGILFTIGLANSVSIDDPVNSLGAQYVGDYSTAGLLLGDRWIPDYGAVKAYTDTATANSANWDTAYGWGDHASAGYGDVSKVGTPVNNQIGVWTGDGTIEGDANLTWTGTYLMVGSGANPQVYFTADQNYAIYSIRESDDNKFLLGEYSNTASHTNEVHNWRLGGSINTPVAAPTDAIIKTEYYLIHDGTIVNREAGKQVFQVDGVIATDDFDTKYIWYLKEGAAANAQVLELNVNGLEYSADHSTDQAANDRWIPDKGYVDGVAAGASLWTDNGTNMSPTSAGKDILLTSGTEYIYWGGTYNTGIWSPSAGTMVIQAGGRSILYGMSTNTYLGNGTTGNLPVDNAELNLVAYDITSGLLSSRTVASIVAGKVDISGTPADNQFAIWTNSNTIEGESNVIYTGTSSLRVGQDTVSAFYTDIAGGSISTRSAGSLSWWLYGYSNTANTSPYHAFVRGGGASITSPTTAVTDALVGETRYQVYDGTSNVNAGYYKFLVDGSISTGDFDTKYEWHLKEGASTLGLLVTLGINGFEYAADHSTDQAANNRWIPDKEYVDGVSDIRLKENILYIEEDSVVSKLQKLQGYTFNLKKDPTKERRLGLMAQEVIKEFPEAVSEFEDGTLSVRYKDLVAVLVEAIKEQQKEIDSLKK